jgi:hypothetical protein
MAMMPGIMEEMGDQAAGILSDGCPEESLWKLVNESSPWRKKTRS